MKKTYLLILSLVLVAVVAMTAMASGTYTAAVASDKTTANPGNEITVTVSVTGVTGQSGGLAVTYDAASLELTGGSFLIENTTLSDFSAAQKNGVFLLSAAREISGDFAKLTFKVKEDAPFNPTKIAVQTKVGGVTAEASVSVSVVCPHDYTGMAWTASEEDTHTHTRTCKICNIPETEEHEWTLTGETAATCGAEGSREYKCADCGAEKEETTPKLANHTWDSGAVTKEPTCAAEGETTFTCSVCQGTKTEPIAKLPHVFDHDCDTGCNNCDYTRETTHAYKGEWTSDPTGHWHECTICAHRNEETIHEPGPEPTEHTSQNCTICGFIIQPALGHTHAFGEEWTTDETGHWHACAGCETKSEYELHSFDNSCDTTCDVCGYTRQTEHTYYENMMSDKTGHWEQCRICGHKTELQAHTPDAQGECTVCGCLLEIPGHNHTYLGDWQWDISGHWKTCECGQNSAPESHGWGEGEVIKKPTETADGARRYTCDTCGAEKTELIPAGTKITERISWVIPVVILGVLAAGAAIFVIVGVVGGKKKAGKYSEVA